MSAIDEWTNEIVHGDARKTMLEIPPKSVHCVGTSIPYYRKRDYGDHVDAVWGGDDECDHEWAARETPITGGQNTDDNPPNVASNRQMQDGGLRDRDAVDSDYCRRCGAWRGQFGLEPTLDQYVRNVVEVADAVGHVLREDGVFFLNLGDSFASKPRGNKNPVESTGLNNNEASFDAHDAGQDTTTEFEAKQKMLVPHRVAIALQEAGWWAREDNVWAKPNPIPHPVKDRRREDKEFVFCLTQNPHYWYDLDAIREPHKESSLERNQYGFESAGIGSTHAPREDRVDDVLLDAGDACHPNGKNPGDILEVATRPYADAHYATFPADLVRPFIKAGCPPKVCAQCETPYQREMDELPLEEWPRDAIERDQRRRALERADAAGLTDAHFEAIRAVGIQDAGQATLVYDGADNNADETERLATEAKDALGEYFREFLTVAQVPTGNWVQQCDCSTDETVPGVVLDPFGGTGTTCSVAGELGRRWVGIDLDPGSVALAQRDLGVTVDEPERLPEREDGQTGLEAISDGGETNV